MQQFRLRNFGLVIFVFSLIAMAGLWSCGKKGPIKIGFMAGLSGRVADLGVPGRNGVMLAIEQLNAAGGINGRPVSLLVRDDQQDAGIARKAVTDLIDEKVEVIIGPMTSSMATATVALVDQSETIMVSPTVTTTDLKGKDDHFIRVIDVTTEYAQRSARYQVEKLKHFKASVIYDLKNAAYTQSWFRDFRKAYEALGGTLLLTKTYTSDQDATFYQFAQSLVASNPDVVVIIANAVDAALICQQIRKVNANVSIDMAEWASTERFIELAGKASENVYAAQFLDRQNKSARYLTFHNQFKARFGQEPGFAGVAGYDAAMVVLDALMRKKKDQSLKQAILEKDVYQCLQQPVKIDRFGDAERKTYISVIKDGQFVLAE